MLQEMERLSCVSPPKPEDPREVAFDRVRPRYQCLNMEGRSRNVILTSGVSGRDWSFFNTLADKTNQNGNISKLPVAETEPGEGTGGHEPSYANHVTEQTCVKLLHRPPQTIQCYVATVSPSSWGHFQVLQKHLPATSAPRMRVAGGQPLAGAQGPGDRRDVPAAYNLCYVLHSAPARAGPCRVTGPLAVEGEASGDTAIAPVPVRGEQLSRGGGGMLGF